jgi:hypothetical protein
VQPRDPELWAQLARIQVYSTSQFTTDLEKKARLEEAFASIEEGLKVAPEYSMLHAVHALALDWYGQSSIAGENWLDYLIQVSRLPSGHCNTTARTRLRWHITPSC